MVMLVLFFVIVLAKKRKILNQRNKKIKKYSTIKKSIRVLLHKYFTTLTTELRNLFFSIIYFRVAWSHEKAIYLTVFKKLLLKKKKKNVK